MSPPVAVRFFHLAPFPARATAVEGFEPNVAVARARLAPLGVLVFQGSRSSGRPLQFTYTRFLVEAVKA